MRHVRGLVASWLVLTILAVGAASAAAAPEGQLTWAVHISLAPTWFDPAETSGIITPFMVLLSRVGGGGASGGGVAGGVGHRGRRIRCRGAARLS